MSRIGETANRPHAEVFSGHVDPARAHQDLLRGLDGKQACPFCGAVSEKSSSPCQRCGMENTPDARKATKARIGPWYVLQARNPAAPGMRWETLLGFVRKGRVRARSVVRGPTTHQLWRFAAHVKGLSREFGLCYSCGSQIDPAANVCPQCNRLQEPPANPDVLLEDAGEDALAAAGRAAVYRELPEPGKSSANPAEAPPTPPPPKPEPEDAEIVIPALGAFRPDDVEVKPIEVKPAAAPQPAPIPVPNWFASTPAAPPPAASPAPSRPTPSRPAPPRPPVDENPFSIPSPTPRKKNNNNGGGGDTFLSAKELAAAFQLSFDPSANMDSVDVPDEMSTAALPEAMPPGMGQLPMRQQTAMNGPAGIVAPTARRRSRLAGFRRFALFMLILVGTGFGVMMWVDPVFRQKTVDWTRASFAKLHAYATAQDMKPRHERTLPESPDASKPAQDELQPRTPAAAPKSQTPSADPASDAQAKVPSEPKIVPEPPLAPSQPTASVSAPAAVTPNPIAPAPALSPIEPAKNPEPPAPTPGASAQQPPAEKEEAIPDTYEGQLAREKQLFKAGLQAEFGRPPNYEAALKSYNDIKKLSKDVWPSNLDTRINDVKRKMK